MASYWPKYGQGHGHWNVDIMYDKINYTIKKVSGNIVIQLQEINYKA